MGVVGSQFTLTLGMIYHGKYVLYMTIPFFAMYYGCMGLAICFNWDELFEEIYFIYLVYRQVYIHAFHSSNKSAVLNCRVTFINTFVSNYEFDKMKMTKYMKEDCWFVTDPYISFRY